MDEKEKNILFYDSIANEYNTLDNKDSSNKIVRENVKERFLQSVKGNSVLDFGGGTGLDLEWLTKSFSRVYFCEPSEQMRSQAMRLNSEKLKTNSIVFLNINQCDFKTWLPANPFPEKLDGILANFAVFNNIENISLLFESFSFILKAEGSVGVNVLNPKPFKLYKRHFLQTIFSILFRKTVTIESNQGNSIQTIYLHSISSIKMAALPYFELKKIEDFNGFGFMYLEFRKRQTFK